MAIFQKNLKDLFQKSNSEGKKVSIYINTNIKEDPEKNRIKLKNAYTEILENLKKEGEKSLQQNLEKNIEPLLSDTIFHSHLSVGLAMFLTSDYFVYFNLPDDVPDHFEVSNSFNLVPLTKSLKKQEEFLVLDLEENRNRLLKCNLSDFEVLNIDSKIWPKSIEDLNRFKDRDKALQQHSGMAGGQEIFHGHNKWQDKVLADKFDYFRMIHDSLEQTFNPKLLLVLAATRENADLFTEQNKEFEIAKQIIKGSAKAIANKELFEQALKIIDSQQEKENINLFKSIKDNDKKDSNLTTNPEEILQKSKEARVETLIISFPENIKQLPNDTLKLNKIIMNVVVGGGKVYSIQTNNADYEFGAVLRY